MKIMIFLLFVLSVSSCSTAEVKAIEDSNCHYTAPNQRAKSLNFDC